MASVTMATLARELKVSKNTVSLALRHDPQLPLATRERAMPFDASGPHPVARSRSRHEHDPALTVTAETIAARHQAFDPKLDLI